MPPVGEWIRSPYDTEVRYGKKRSFEWVGYKVHLSEYCDDDLPQRVTQVETVAAIEQDHQVLVPIQADVAAKGVLPARASRRCGLYQCQTHLAQSRKPRD